MTNEYFLHPVSPTEAARIPFPIELPLEARDAYMAAPPRDVLTAAPRVPLPTGSVIPVEPDSVEPAAPSTPVDSEE